MNPDIVTRLFVVFALLTVTVTGASATTLIDPNANGIGQRTYDETYDDLVDALYQGKAVEHFDGKLWVPWYSTSSVCTEEVLQKGSACNAEEIDSDSNCMVSDEFSQVGMLVSMGDDEERMDAFVNTIEAIPSDYGKLPSWRAYKDEDSIYRCEDGINSNCDSASDADARVIIALFTAANNDRFSQYAREEYSALARQVTDDFVEHNLEKTCRPSSLGEGDICYWLAAGPNARNGGLSSRDFTYTGYFPDAINAMLAAYAATGDEEYATIADHLTLNYLQAARYDGKRFTAPPGRSFKWTNLNGVPRAQCTGNCYPVMWDDADATRSIGICQSIHYAELAGHELPLLESYCSKWQGQHMKDSTKAAIQYYPDGRAATSQQSGYFAQGLQSMFHQGASPTQYEATLRSALGHYSTTTKTWDWTACFGVYTQTFPMRSLGSGIGRDSAAFTLSATPPDTNKPPHNDTKAWEAKVENLNVSCEAKGNACIKIEDATSGTCRTVRWNTEKGDIKVMTCEKNDGWFETYRQAYPPSTDFKACMNQGCVDKWSGWARFKPVPQTTTDDDTTEPGTDTTRPPAPTGTATSTAATTGLGSVQATCTIDGGCKIISDTMSGTCRTTVWDTSKGQAKTLACEKGTKVEVYRQAHPADDSFKACVSTGCIDRWGGWASFTQEYSETTVTDTGSDDTTVTGDTGTTPPTTETGIISLEATCTTTGGCTLVHDETSGTCRTIAWSTDHGPVKIMGCEKGINTYEVYRQQYPSGITFTACLAGGCVDRWGGWAKITA